MANRENFVCLDVGEKRIGVAIGDSEVRIAIPYETIEVDGNELEAIGTVIVRENAQTLVIGYPRNQSGEETAQTQYVKAFAETVKDLVTTIEFQDESLTSVLAEQQLVSYKKPYSKGDIDAQAATIILEDFLEARFGK
jgi:putative Holliday junction resolvase